ncbi:hypothetical protein [Paraburkholderia bannensis]|uniref:hypothetical protein n=1 Tax=Paraburkholderia bannensis TaxID=765414 RepID=UPI000480866F|nr:hypothetical protein [Paraburkholderia bannensis]
MKHSIAWIAFFTASAVMLTCPYASAASSDSTASAATSPATASPAPGTSSESGQSGDSASSHDSGLATEDASRASEQQLLGLPRVPKDTNLSAPLDDGTASTTRVALRRSTSTHVSAAPKRVEVFAAPFPSSIYSSGATRSVYKNPW